MVLQKVEVRGTIKAFTSNNEKEFRPDVKSDPVGADIVTIGSM